MSFNKSYWNVYWPGLLSFEKQATGEQGLASFIFAVLTPSPVSILYLVSWTKLELTIFRMNLERIALSGISEGPLNFKFLLGFLNNISKIDNNLVLQKENSTVTPQVLQWTVVPMGSSLSLNNEQFLVLCLLSHLLFVHLLLSFYSTCDWDVPAWTIFSYWFPAVNNCTRWLYLVSQSSVQLVNFRIVTCWNWLSLIEMASFTRNMSIYSILCFLKLCLFLTWF